MLARDLQSIVLYDQDGKFVGVRRPSSKLPIEINGNEILIEDAIGSTGLDLKVRLTDSLFQIYSWRQLGLFGNKVNHAFHFLFHQTDPGVPIVYAGFGALMLTTCISYLSHSQVCAHVYFFFLAIVLIDRDTIIWLPLQIYDFVSTALDLGIARWKYSSCWREDKSSQTWIFWRDEPVTR